MTSTTIVLYCSSCGTQLPVTAKFCFECAHPVNAATPPDSANALAKRMLDASVALDGERKLVTVLFADLKGSLELIADRDPEEAKKLLDPVLEHMCEAVEKFGGTVSQVMGDGIMALFGAPLAFEDHALRACNAALAMQDLVRHYGEELERAHGVPIQIRVGLNSGEVVLRMSGHGLHMSYTAIGQAVHIAARMEQMARAGAVFATADTIGLTEGHIEARWLGPLEVRGFDRPIEVAEISRATTTRTRFDATPTRVMTPFIGRDDESQQLRDVFLDVSNHRVGRLVAVTGDAGIGKSRLIHEFFTLAAAQGRVGARWRFGAVR